MSDTFLDAPKPERPPAEAHEHTGPNTVTHWDASYWVTYDNGWTWERVNSVNLKSEAEARAWLNMMDAFS